MILITGQIEGVSSRKDRTVKLTIGTQELSPKDAGEVFRLTQSFCYFGIKEEPFNKEEVNLLDNLKADVDNLKTPSQRLRGILYRLYETNSEGFTDFTTFYQSKLEKVIEGFKMLLDANTY